MSMMSIGPKSSSFTHDIMRHVTIFPLTSGLLSGLASASASASALGSASGSAETRTSKDSKI